MPSPVILVVDLGTTSLRCSIVDQRGQVLAKRQSTVPEIRDREGLAWDGGVLGAQVLSETKALAQEWTPAGIAIANQRTTALVWDAETGTVEGPVLSWSDNRTAGLDRALRGRGVRMIPGLSASKWCWLLERCDPDGARMKAGRLRVGTLDSWLVYVLTEGRCHVSDYTNASHTGLFNLTATDWDYELAEQLGMQAACLPELVPTQPEGLRATALSGAPPVLSLIGDQQASLVGQGCETVGAAKITFGTSGVLNVVTGGKILENPSRAAFGNVLQASGQSVTYGAEASVLGAGSSIEWLVRLGIISGSAQIDAIVDPADRSGVIFIPALDGIGVPHWNARAGGAFFGMTSADGAPELTRAVLDGIIAGAAEIITQVETATGQALTSISIDGGLTNSAAFKAILTATIDRPFHLAPAAEATTGGAAILAFRALGLEPAPLAPSQILAAPDGTVPADLRTWQDGVKQVLEHTKTRRSGN